MTEFRDTKAKDAPGGDGPGGGHGTKKGKRRSCEGSAPDAARAGGLRLVTDGAIDQHGRRWVRIGQGGSARWYPAGDFARSRRSDIMGELADAGLPVLMPKHQSALLAEIEEFKGSRKALVATRPGWIGAADGPRCYVCGDGTVLAPKAAAPEIILTFRPNPKFTPRGILQEWQAAVEPVVKGQALPVFVLDLALAPAMLELAPPDFRNQVLEIEGEGGRGKSTLAFLAASVWAGDPTRETLGAESWLRTLETLETRMAEHADCLLVLDEANNAGTDEKSERDTLRKAVFRLAGTEGKDRRGTGVEVTGVRLITISTSNVRLERLLRASPEITGALQARVISLPLPRDGALRALDRVPTGFPDERRALEALLAAIATCYGAAGRAFAERLVRERAKNEPKLRRRIARLIEKFNELTGAGKLGGNEARASKLFALAYAAGRLARAWGIIPKAWGKASAVAPRVYGLWRSGAGGGYGAAERLWACLGPTQTRWVDAGSVKTPLKRKAFRATAGFLLEEGKKRILLVPAEALQKGLAEHVGVMRALRDPGVVEGENGKQSKLTTKAPRSLSVGRERVYRIRLDRLEMLIPPRR